MILNCWPELVTLADNYIFPLLSLFTEKPALTNTWQINVSHWNHKAEKLGVNELPLQQEQKNICFQTRLSQERKSPVQVQFAGGHAFQKCFHLQFLMGTFIWVSCIIV